MAIAYDCYEFTILAAYLPLIFNDDSDGLMQLEIREFRSFTRKTVIDASKRFGDIISYHWAMADSDEEAFFTRCAITGVWGSCHNMKLMFSFEE